MKELEYFWKKVPMNQIGRSWYPPETSTVISCVLITDASKYAWGSHVHLFDVENFSSLDKYNVENLL